MPLSEEERLHYEQALLELRTLQRVTDELSRSLDLDEVLGRCLDLAVEVAHAAAGVLYLNDPARGTFRRVVVRHLSNEVAPPLFPSEQLRQSLASSSVQVEVTPDSPNPLIVAAYHQGIRRMVMLALRSESTELVGFLAVHFLESPPLGSTLKTLEAIARQGAVAIANARVHQIVERRGRMANGLREFSERALSCSDPAALYQLILASALELTRNDRGAIGQISGKTGRVVAGVGVDRDLLGIELPITTPYLAEALTRREPEACEDTAVLDPDSMFGRIAREKGTRSYLLATVWHAERPVGLLFVASGEPRRYEPEDLEAVQILATLAGEAVERVGALDRLAGEKRRLDAVLEHMPVVISVIGPSGDLLHINAAGRAFAESFGTHGNWREALDKIQTLDREGKPVAREDFAIMQAFQGRKPPPRELTLVGQNGRRMHVVSVAAPLLGPDGRVEAVVSGVQDVTSLRQLADAKDHFLRIASHELRSPLTALRATTSLLEMDPSAIDDLDRRTLLLSRVQRQVGRLTRLVEQLIDSVRLNATEPPLECVDTDLVALCTEVIEALPESKRVILETAGPLRGVWDPVRLEQVLSNLLSNAARYSPPESAILMRLHSDESLVFIEVVDRGIGIPAEQIESLFTPFFRATNAAAQSKGGLGLGLHIAHEIVRRHGGSLTVESRLGEGSRFLVTLPVDTDTPSG